MKKVRIEDKNFALEIEIMIEEENRKWNFKNFNEWVLKRKLRNQNFQQFAKDQCLYLFSYQEKIGIQKNRRVKWPCINDIREWDL